MRASFCLMNISKGRLGSFKCVFYFYFNFQVNSPFLVVLYTKFQLSCHGNIFPKHCIIIFIFFNLVDNYHSKLNHNNTIISELRPKYSTPLHIHTNLQKSINQRPRDTFMLHQSVVNSKISLIWCSGKRFLDILPVFNMF